MDNTFSDQVEIDYEEILKLYNETVNGEPDVQDMLACLIASHGEMMAFNEALDKNPEYSDISGMSGLAELVLDKLIAEFDKLVEANK
jgi:hypothetical protein|tara:strand:- start:1873 stop:2133 length:261 start_codon:yes stop_codon:yes gene_type:complete